MEDRRGLLLPFPEIILFSPAPATEESRYSSSSAPPAPVAEVVVYSSSFDAGEVCGLDKEGCSLVSCIVPPNAGFGSDGSCLSVVKSSLSVKSRSMSKCQHR